MKTTVSKSDFRDAFQNMNRGDQFSYDGLGVLFDYMEEMDEACETEWELDVIALCCDFAEHDTALEAALEYGFVGEEDAEPDDLETAALDWLTENTTVLSHEKGVIVQGF